MDVGSKLKNNIEMNASLKVILLSICILTFCTFADGYAQHKESPFANVVSGGVVAKLKPYFNDRIHLNIGRDGRIYSAQQAAVILDDFFSKNQPQEFKVKYKGGNESKMYVIGTLITSSGEYNLSIYYTHFEGKREVVQQIRIERHEN